MEGKLFFQVWKRAKPSCCHCDIFFSCPAATILPFISPSSFLLFPLLPLSSLLLFPQSTRIILSSKSPNFFFFFPLYFHCLDILPLSSLPSVAFIHLTLNSSSPLSSLPVSFPGIPTAPHCPFFCLTSFPFHLSPLIPTLYLWPFCIPFSTSPFFCTYIHFHHSPHLPYTPTFCRWHLSVFSFSLPSIPYRVQFVILFNTGKQRSLAVSCSTTCSFSCNQLNIYSLISC